MADRSDIAITRRRFAQGSAALVAASLSVTGAAGAAAATPAKAAPLSIGILAYAGMDQIDLTGPFEVLSRLPGAAVGIIGRDRTPIRDTKGLILTPEMSIEETPRLELLVVPGGPGQEALMDDEPILELIRRQVASGRTLFSVCTGALICGAAGVLKGRRATTHWSTFDLLPYFGAAPVDERVVVDGTLITAAGVTAGIDGALRVAALIGGERVAQEIQLSIEYAPEPPFHAGSPKTAPAVVLESVQAQMGGLKRTRLQTARRVAARLGVRLPEA